MNARSSRPWFEQACLSGALLAASVLLVTPSFAQRPQLNHSLRAASAQPAGRAWFEQDLRARARRRWERHEAKVQRNLEKQRLNATKRENKKAKPGHPPAKAR